MPNPVTRGQTLHVANWPLYLAEDTLSNFEESCGVTLNYEVYISNEILLDYPSGGQLGLRRRRTHRLCRDHHDSGRAAPAARYDEDPQQGQCADRICLNPDYDPGNVYTLPYQWGTIAVAYNTEKVSDDLSSWEQVWAHDGPVAWIEDRRMMFGFALILLGYDPNTENADQIAEASAYLEERSGNVVALATDNFRDLLADGDVDITLAYDGYILSLIEQCECDTYAYALMEEASGIWIDNLAVPSDAPNPELAMVFIDYILDPQVGAAISNATAYASPNQAAIDQELINQSLRQNNPGYSMEESDAHFFSIVELSAEQEQRYNDAWEELLSAIGF